MNQNVVATVAEISTREFEQFRQFMLAASGVDLGPTKRALVQARPACVAPTGARLDCFARAASNALAHRAYY